MSAKKKVLFVDDELRILDGIKRIMHSLTDEWDLVFADSGKEALEVLSSGDFDVIVSDMRMPGMNGGELLTEVQKRYPQMVRIALSGTAEKDMIVRSVGPIHQYLAKPCDAETLKSAVVRSTGLRSLLRSDKLKSVVSQTGSLPSLPSLYIEFMAELKKPEPSLTVIEKIITRDLGMTTKVLQLVNSSFFGVRRHVSSPGDAIKLLGLDNIESLVLTAQVFSQFNGAATQSFSLQHVWDHSSLVGSCAKAIAKSEHAPPLVVDNSFIAGLLHDVGILIIAARFPKEYEQIARRIEEGKMLHWQLESEIIGASHAEIGAYLLGLWGFSDPVIEATAFHHHPMVCCVGGFVPVTAVHVANAILDGIERGDNNPPYDPVNEEYLGEIGMLDKLPKWREICADIVRQNKDEQ